MIIPGWGYCFDLPLSLSVGVQEGCLGHKKSAALCENAQH